MTKFDTVLVANRGEIALRVMRACRELGIRSVAVYSEVDRDAPHVRYADDAYLIGPPAANESYLNIDRLIETAHRAGAQAIHPGYGFLSENTDFARAIAAANLTFIGPSPETVDMVAGKVAARKVAQAVDVPVVPGTLKPLNDVSEVYPIADEFGYPIAIKAVGGGGGRGLRVVHNADQVKTAYESASREAEHSFKDKTLYVEKYLANPRHIEMQILGDNHGTVIAIGERDCSVQRRHQKLIEESPSPAITPEIRAELTAAAVRLGSYVKYTGAGTLEFLFEDGNFYFLELNSRIQVEHPVTELVYGFDLVKAQIRIAQGEPLWFTQEDVVPRGHAIECRINAEDPTNNFRPMLGVIGDYKEPVGFGVRVDSGVRANYNIPQFYDSLLSKLIVWGQDRQESLARARRALQDYVIGDVTTVIPFHLAALNHPTFVEGDISVNFIPRHPDLIEGLQVEPVKAFESNGDTPARTFELEVNGHQFTVRVAGEAFAELAAAGPAVAGGAVKRPARRGKGKGKGDSGQSAADVDGVITPLTGTIRVVEAEPGQEVTKDQVLFVIEAMKMENEIMAPHDGKLATVSVEVGSTVDAGAVLATYEK
jgi:acetyl-CoA/propionyl-CoA carboxylase biotin carboxyl carrier protein